MKKFIKIVSVIFAFVLVIIIAGFGYIVFVLDLNDYKKEIEQAAWENSRVNLKINGDLSWSLYPVFGINVNKIQINTFDGYKFASLGQAKLGVSIKPLFKNQVQVNQVLIEDVDLKLIKYKNGVGNWQSFQPKSQDKAITQPAETTPSSDQKIILNINQLDIADVDFSYDDRLSGLKLKVKDFSLQAKDVNLQKSFPLSLDFTAKYEDQSGKHKIKFSSKSNILANIDNMQYGLNKFTADIKADSHLLPNEHLKLSLKADVNADLKQDKLTITKLQVKALDSEINLNGKVANLSKKPTIKAKLNVKVTSLPDILQTFANFKIALPAEITDGLSVNADINADLKRDVLKISKLEINALGSEINVNGKVTNLSKKPIVNAQLALTATKLKDLIQVFAKTEIKTSNPNALQKLSLTSNIDSDSNNLNIKNLKLGLDQTKILGSVSVRLANKALKFKLKADKINVDDYLPPSAPKTTKKEKPDEKPNQPIVYSKDKIIPVEALEPLNINGNLAIDEVKVFKIPINDLSLAITANQGLIELKRLSLAIFDGKITNTAIINTKTKTPRISFNSKTKDIQIGQALNSLLELDKLSGAANLNIDLSVRGNSVFDFVHSVTGDIGFNIKNGTVKEINVSKYVCQGIASVNQKQITPSLYPNHSDFKRMDGKILLNKGFINNKNITVSLASMNLKGQGTASLPKQNFNYQLGLTVTGVQQDQACKVAEDFKKLEWGVICKGLFYGDPIKFCKPDFDKLKGIVASIAQQKANKAAKDAEKKIKAQADQEIQRQKQKLQQQAEQKKQQLQKQLEQQAKDKLKKLFSF